MNLLASLTYDPAWKEFLSVFRLSPAAAEVADLLVGATLLLLVVGITALTLWTYLGMPGISGRRLAVLLGLRLGALAAICLVLVRPMWLSQESNKEPSTLLIVVDSSESMTFKDEHGDTRWNYLLGNLKDAEPVLQRLRQEQNVSVVFVHFDSDVAPFDPKHPGEAKGQATDFRKMLQKLYEDYQDKGALRGLVILSDGADNVVIEPPTGLAVQWRNRPCPLHTVGYGQEKGDDNNRDIAVTDISTEPREVPVKNELTVEGTVDVSGFDNPRVRVELYVNDDPKPASFVDTVLDTNLPPGRKNKVALKCLAPDQPGEMKVTFKVRPLPNEVNDRNNELSTYVTVLKEGVSVLIVDRGDHFPELQLVRDVLLSRKGVHVTTRWLRDDKPADGRDFFDLDRTQYDVIILGDVTAAQVQARDSKALAKIAAAVNKGSTGLLIVAGELSLGSRSDWAATEIAKLLPVRLDLPPQGREVTQPVKFVPLEAGLRHYIMRFGDKAEEDTAKKWESLPEVNGLTRLGEPNAGAFVLADGKFQGGQVPVLVGRTAGKVRTLVLGTDTTHQWIVNPQGRDLHQRFWQQLVLWLASKDDNQGTVWVQPGLRRLPTGDKLQFTAGLRDGNGLEPENARLAITVITPDKQEIRVKEEDLTRAEQGQSGSFWKTDQPGEYVLVVADANKDDKGKPVLGEVRVRYTVYPRNTQETTGRAARHDFLRELSKAGGGKYQDAEKMVQLLQDIEKLPPPGSGRAKTVVKPDWRSTGFAGLSAGSLAIVVFVGLLSLEWFLRRRWGMV